MKRVEIIGNKAIEEDLFDVFKKMDIVKQYTKIPTVLGVGSSGPRQGDQVWPEENFLLIIYCDETEADKIMTALKEVKSYFRDEGLKFFESELVCTA